MTRHVHPLAAPLCFLTKLISGTTVRFAGFGPDMRQRVYASNHTSHLDFIVIWSALPAGLRVITRPIAARDYWERSSLRRYLSMQVFNSILIDRAEQMPAESKSAAGEHALRSIDSMIEGMGSEYSLIMFPEGTRSKGDNLGEFKSGLYHLCKRKPGLEVIPVYLENLNRILPKGEILPVPFLSAVTFGSSLILTPDENKKEFLERVRQAILGLKS